MLKLHFLCSLPIQSIHPINPILLFISFIPHIAWTYTATGFSLEKPLYLDWLIQPPRKAQYLPRSEKVRQSRYYMHLTANDLKSPNSAPN